jgi:hypothetical protein
MSVVRVLAALVGVGLIAAACGGSTSEGNAQRSGTTSPAGPPPDVDQSIHSVPLDQIVFDTFDGGSIPLSESTPELRAQLLDVIPPIDVPVYDDDAGGDWLEPDDLVLGYQAGDRPYAYPFKILNYHEVVNDELDGVPLLVSYCPLCSSGVIYDRRVGGEVLSFGNTSALLESDLVMVDRSTGSYWWQVAGEAIVGDLTGTELTVLPSTVARWSDWVGQHPDTLVLSRDTGHDRPYERDAFAGYADAIDDGRFTFPVGEAATDGRLAASRAVVVVEHEGVVRAYPVDDSVEPIEDDIAGLPVLIRPNGSGADVFRRTGTTLEAMPSRSSFWFAVVAAFPNVELYEPGSG